MPATGADTDLRIPPDCAIGPALDSVEWSATPIGPPEDWPLSLRTVVRLMLNSKFPMFTAWGEELTFIYNDAYAPILGAKHPGAIGKPFESIWGEIWQDIRPLIDRAGRRGNLAGGHAAHHESAWL